MRRLVRHAAVGLGCTALAVSAAVAGLGSPPVSGTALAVPAVQVPVTAGADSSALDAERAARQAQADRSAERQRLSAAAVDQASRRSSALTTQGQAISEQQAKIVAARQAAAATREKQAAAAKAAAAKAAAAAEAKRRAAAKKRAEQTREQGYRPGTTDPRDIARQILDTKFGYGDDQYDCFNNIIIRESNWDIDATNAESGAYGIPQALPGSKMASAGPDWRTSPATQITWAIGYMNDRYGSPCEAWGFKSANGWY